MPGPSSVTSIATPPTRWDAATVTVPAPWTKAFETRTSRIWRTAGSEHTTVGSPGSTSTTSCRSVAWAVTCQAARCASSRSPIRISSRRGDGCRASSIRSRMVISRRSTAPSASASSSRWSDPGSPSAFSSWIRMPVSGVRSWCEALALNAALPFDEHAESLGGGVERLRRLVELGHPGTTGADVEVASAEPGDRHGELLDRFRQPPRLEAGRDRGEQEDRRSQADHEQPRSADAGVQPCGRGCGTHDPLHLLRSHDGHRDGELAARRPTFRLTVQGVEDRPVGSHRPAAGPAQAVAPVDRDLVGVTDLQVLQLSVGDRARDGDDQRHPGGLVLEADHHLVVVELAHDHAQRDSEPQQRQGGHHHDQPEYATVHRSVPVRGRSGSRPRGW